MAAFMHDPWCNEDRNVTVGGSDRYAGDADRYDRCALCFTVAREARRHEPLAAVTPARAHGERPRRTRRWRRISSGAVAEQRMQTSTTVGAVSGGELIVTPDEDVVAFFLALPKARRREYDALAELDRRFGEDVEAELRSRQVGDGSDDARGAKS